MGEVNCITGDCVETSIDTIKHILKKDCINLKEKSRIRGCVGCPGNFRIKIFKCLIHKECTLRKEIDNIKCCETCEDYEPTNPNP